MNAEQLRELQAPLKAEYTASSAAAIAELHASGSIDLKNLACLVASPGAINEEVRSGLHRMAGGDGSAACSGDMLLQSLIACSGVTFAVVATAMELRISSATINVTGTMDFRGTLGIDRTTPVGLTSIALTFTVESPEPDEKIDKLIQLTERYCVVLQTLKQGVSVSSRRATI
jgi:uncharacterized OsmC-like protein